jgi:hypothetical protein
MRSGVKAKEIVEGKGDIAARDKTVVVNVRMFLNRGNEIPNIGVGGPKFVIDLSQRECIAGLRYGIEGMRVGGRRNITVSPHLAFGAAGVADLIPPNAVIRCEIELLEVRDHGVRKAEDYPPGKHLGVFHSGDPTQEDPRWQFGIKENGHCGIYVTHPIPSLGWRHARHSQSEAHLGNATTLALFEHAFKMQELFPQDCFVYEELWPDAAQLADPNRRQGNRNVSYLWVSVSEQGNYVIKFYLAETSRAMVESPLLKQINAMLDEIKHRATGTGKT